MKKLLLSFAFIVGYMLVSGQNELDIFYQGRVVNNSTITVYGNILDDVVVCAMAVGNNTASTLNVFVRRVIIQEVPGSSCLMCFGDYCYPPQTDTTRFPATLEAGAVNESFLGDYSPAGTRGATTVTYEFFDDVTLDHRVAAEVTVNYHTSGDFSILMGDTTVINNSTLVQFTSDIQAVQLEQQLRVVNNTDQTEEIYVRRIINQEVQGSENLFCFGTNCYPPSADTSLNSFEIYPGTIDSSFKADYSPNGNAGKTSITYEFFNMADGRAEIRESVTVIFNLSGVGINEPTALLNAAYPNPASSFVLIGFDKQAVSNNAAIVIRNMAGQTVTQASLDSFSGKAIIDVSGLPNGMYAYSLIDSGRIIATRKLIVQH